MFFVCFILTESFLINLLRNEDESQSDKQVTIKTSERIQVAVVACEKPMVQLFKALFSSMIVMSESEIDLHVIFDGAEVQDGVKEYVGHFLRFVLNNRLILIIQLLFKIKYNQRLPPNVKVRINIITYPIWFPSGDIAWKSIGKKCACGKLFLPVSFS